MSLHDLRLVRTDTFELEMKVVLGRLGDRLYNRAADAWVETLLALDVRMGIRPISYSKLPRVF